MKFLPQQKGGGAGKVLAILKPEGEAQHFWGYRSFRKKKKKERRGGQWRKMFYPVPVLKGGGGGVHTVFPLGPAIFPFHSPPPLPVIIDQSFRIEITS